MIFDTHAHYDDEAFDGDRPELQIGRAHLSTPLTGKEILCPSFLGKKKELETTCLSRRDYSL